MAEQFPTLALRKLCENNIVIITGIVAIIIN